MSPKRASTVFLLILSLLIILVVAGFDHDFTLEGLVLVLVGIPIYTLFGLLLFLILYFELPILTRFRLLLSLRRRHMLPENWDPNDNRVPRQLLNASVSTLLFFVSFLLYFSIMVVFFYLAGEPFSWSPPYLLVGAFAGVVTIRLSRHTSSAYSQNFVDLVHEFLVPFGTIAGIFVLGYLGQPTPFRWLTNQLAIFWPIIMIFFVTYLWLDEFFEHIDKPSTS
jgi:hypothetical protein